MIPDILKEQSFELLVVIISVASYLFANAMICVVAKLISGKTQGVIRNFLKGITLVGVFACYNFCFLNGNVKIYQVLLYVLLILVANKIFSVARTRLTRLKFNKKNNK